LRANGDDWTLFDRDGYRAGFANNPYFKSAPFTLK
jgi:hypothetical protein